MTAAASQIEPWKANIAAIPAKSAARLQTNAGAAPSSPRARAINAPGSRRQAVAAKKGEPGARPVAGKRRESPSSAGATSHHAKGSARVRPNRSSAVIALISGGAAPPGRAPASGRPLRRPRRRRAVAAAPAVHRDRVGPLAGEVLVGDLRQVDPARSREPVPLPEPRVHLHQAVGAVARVALELDLRVAHVSELAQELEPLVDHLVDPDRLPDAARPHSRRRLPQLAAAEAPERLAVGGEVAAERVELVVATGDEF